MLDRLAEAARTGAGIVRIRDFGCTHAGTLGSSACAVSPGIEAWKGVYFLRVEVVLSRGSSFRKTSVVKWPYSRHDARDLDSVLADLGVMSQFPPGQKLVDRRGLLARAFDRAIRRKSYGIYTLRSPAAIDPAKTVTAEFCDFRGQAEVSIVERTSSRGFILAQMPHGAIASVRAAVSDYADRG
jgi:hypothetical protein